MDNDQILEKNLKNIEQGASGLRIFSAIFRVLAVVCAITLGLFFFGTGQVEDQTLGAFAQEYQPIISHLVECVLLGWVCELASKAFDSIAALTRENKGLV